MSLPLTPSGKAVDQIINAENNAQMSPIFVGWAPPTSLDTDPAWLIAQITYEVDNVTFKTLRVANGKFDYNQKWTDRAILPYS